MNARSPFLLREIAAPLVLLAVLGTGLLVSVVLWLAGQAAAGYGFVPPAFGSATVTALLQASGGGTLDPLIGADGSRWIFWGALGLLCLPVLSVVVLLGLWAARRAATDGSPSRSLARRRDYRDMYGGGARRRAVQLRPSLSDTSVTERDLGLRLGRLGSEQLYASEEDVLLEIAGPRSNKTSAVVVPAVLSAPGPVITTSNKVDVYTLTIGLRAELGRVFVLDPQRIAGVAQTWWWNPLAGIRDMADAQFLVTHFSQTVGAGHERADPYFTKGAERLLGQLIVAAAASGPAYSLRDVRQWLATRSEEPVALLRAAGMTDIATGLQGTIEAPSDQRGGLYETALTAISCLESEAVARYVTPPATWIEAPHVNRVEELDPWRFVVGYEQDDYGHPIPRDTLYLLTREGAGTGAPVVAALVDHLLRTTAAAATARGGRVDPPVRAVLDEAANICPIRNLPDLYSYFGSMSIQVTSFLQSYQQGVAIWGRSGMDKLWSAATIKLIGAGVHDPEFCEHVSRLIGDHDVPTYSDQRGKGGSSSTLSTRRDRILSAADVAALPKTKAVLISSGRKPGLIDLMPWYAERDADTISGFAAEASAQVREAAIASLGRDNPLSRILAQQDALRAPR
ncbi:type IV secretory system conjugative DNA transfer family protein [Pseudonocardia sp. WMMC193]|uniref:type IV secretory system conjugative DNA transfer family protein n=1 Tax=Pseudonocardia sp. WMMC193 TaxID=2911965 RepID=UPI001F39A3AF|nr:type IV secretory system conjugative DNA transfer family protein [Pseudonocardia sp. WMMC193]MCF7547227.1 TraM recognition domain-containing protein [Pseudonocardia sp. WMMC193]